MGSGIRRFDLEKAGFQQIFRRASEGHILHQGSPAQHVHEALERKLSLPIIPDIAKLRNNSGPLNQPSTSGPFKQPMPKRLRTILEDSIGVRSSLQQPLPNRSGIAGNSSGYGSTITNGGECSGDNENNNSATKFNGTGEDKDYLIANIGIYLVSAKLSIMVCHYEGSSTVGRLSTQKHSSARFSPTNTNIPLSSSTPAPVPTLCDCASSALAMADAKRIQHLLSHIHKLDIIGSAHGGIVDGTTGYSSGAQRFISKTCLSSSVGANGGGIVSRHAQIYSVDSEKLLCAFPEEGYQKVYGKSPLDAMRGGASLRSLLEHCLDKKSESHAINLLQGSNVPNSDPIRLELQVRSGTQELPADVQSIFFRWGHLLFVCQQARSDNCMDSSHTSMAVKTEDSNILSGYNICTPPSDSPARGSMAPDSGIRAAELGQLQYNSSSGIRSPMRQQNGDQQRQAHYIHIHQHGSPHPGQTRVFSLPRAPASVAASLPLRPPVLLTPPESAPPRRQSSYTLPPAKSFEERRFSYPIQVLNGERRPPALPISAHQQLTPIAATSINSAPIGGTTRGSPLATMATSPGSGRISDLRMRSVASAGARQSVSIVTKNVGEALSQPTPTSSPMSASIVQHTPVSLSPTPLSHPHSAHPGCVQVNVYPPPETNDSWRWSQSQQALLQSQAQPPQIHGYTHPNQQQHQQQLSHQHHPHQYQYQQVKQEQAQPVQQRIQSAGSVNQQRPIVAQNHRTIPSPHTHLAHYTMAEQKYQSPLATTMSSPGIAGPSGSHRGDNEKKTCRSCGTDSSPEWRKGPNGHKT
ncbi:hypothetical protein LPJ74_000888 [Coemansia sp. RSA 1843]|nr:hypothetical protein LPJ74_000888 [Coemansia sp. RSA 1843]